ncbi:MAG: hypothetical protein H0T53_16400 [Herpetosiphonaceae bacterium]|nr:hypothetical protein [Herpetosiphonaceae bacterium]
MRICMILSTALPAREGIGFYAWNLAEHLSAQGHTLHLTASWSLHSRQRSLPRL